MLNYYQRTGDYTFNGKTGTGRDDVYSSQLFVGDQTTLLNGERSSLKVNGNWFNGKREIVFN